MTTSPSPPAALGPLPFWTPFEAMASPGAEDPVGARRRGPKVPRQVLVSADRVGVGLSGEDRVGTVFAADWEIKRRLGAGGMGEVFEALNRRDRRRYALKILAGAHAGRAGIVERFRHEFLALSRVRHAGIVRAHSSGCWEGEEWYSMELLRGTSLEERCKAGPLAGGEVVEIGIELCEALAALHAEGVIHRDLKPANVIVLTEPEAGRRVKLLDLGVAKLMPAFYAEGEAVTPPLGRLQTQAGMPLGTPGYMAPEVFMGASAAEGQDVFGLGVTLFRAATGRMPFSPGRVALEEAPRWSHEVGRAMPVALELILRRALAVDPEARFPSMSAFRDELERVQEEMAAENGTRRSERSGPARAAARSEAGTQAAAARAARMPATKRQHGGAGVRVFLLGLACGAALAVGAGRWLDEAESEPGRARAGVDGGVDGEVDGEVEPAGAGSAVERAGSDTAATTASGLADSEKGPQASVGTSAAGVLAAPSTGASPGEDEGSPPPARPRSGGRRSNDRETALATWLAEHRGRVVGCLPSGSDPSTAEAVITVNAAGEVSEVALAGGTWPSLSVGCLRRALRGLKAPAGAGPTIHRLRLG